MTKQIINSIYLAYMVTHIPWRRLDIYLVGLPGP